MEPRRLGRTGVHVSPLFYMPMSQDDPTMRGGSRRWIIRAVEDSLRRLGTDHIDLYQVHRPSPYMDVDENLGSLSDPLDLAGARVRATRVAISAAAKGIMMSGAIVVIGPEQVGQGS
jgi:aryl-alcohol dehydrogenase-like predicted oxidoreductase